MTFEEFLRAFRGIENTKGHQRNIERIEADFKVDIDQIYANDPSFTDLIKLINESTQYTRGIKANFRCSLKGYREYQEYLANGEAPSQNQPEIAEFNEELKKIQLDGVDSYDSRRVYYDDRVPKEEYIPGLISLIEQELEKIFRFFRNWYSCEGCISPDNLDLRVILSPERIKKTYHTLKKEKSIDELIRQYEACGVFAIPTEELKKARKGGHTYSFTDDITGEYHRGKERPEIIIYYRVLDASNSDAYAADVRLVLSHECLHALHAAFAKETFKEQTEKATWVKEALADFFSMTYCLTDDREGIYSASLKRAEKRYQAWRKRLETDWPYAYALYFMRLASGWMPFSKCLEEYKEAGCLKKYANVWLTSHDSMEEAYRILITEKVGFRPELVCDLGEEIKAALPAVREAIRDNSTYNEPYVLEMITATEKQAIEMSNEEADDYYNVDLQKNVNKLQSLLPVYCNDILREHSPEWLDVETINEEIREEKHYDAGYKQVLTVCNTLMVHEETVFRKMEKRFKEGNKRLSNEFLFCYSNVIPEGRVDDAMYDQKYEKE